MSLIASVNVNTQEEFEEGELPEERSLNTQTIPATTQPITTRPISSEDLDQIVFETITTKEFPKQYDQRRRDKKTARKDDQRKKEKERSRDKQFHQDKHAYEGSLPVEHSDSPQFAPPKNIQPLGQPYYPPYYYPVNISMPSMYPNYPNYPYMPTQPYYKPHPDMPAMMVPPHMQMPMMGPSMGYPMGVPFPDYPQNEDYQRNKNMSVNGGGYPPPYPPKNPYAEKKPEPKKSPAMVQLQSKKSFMEEIRREIKSLLSCLSVGQQEEALELMRLLSRAEVARPKNPLYPQIEESEAAMIVSNSEGAFQRIEALLDSQEKMKEVITRCMEKLQLKQALNRIKERRLQKRLGIGKGQSEMKKMLDILVRDPRKVIR